MAIDDRGCFSLPPMRSAISDTLTFSIFNQRVQLS
jgi:hypothetical protein